MKDDFGLGFGMGIFLTFIACAAFVIGVVIPDTVATYQNKPCDRYRQWEYDQKVVTAKCYEEQK
jgi:uncharacterized oligopeptide transporter (OPT) family protein